MGYGRQWPGAERLRGQGAIAGIDYAHTTVGGELFTYRGSSGLAHGGYRRHSASGIHGRR